MNSYPYASLNGFNLLTLLGGNWQPQESRWLGLVSWQALGTIGIAAATLALLWLAWRGGEKRPLLPAAAGGFLRGGGELPGPPHARAVPDPRDFAGAGGHGFAGATGGFWARSACCRPVRC